MELTVECERQEWQPKTRIAATIACTAPKISQNASTIRPPSARLQQRASADIQEEKRRALVVANNLILRGTVLKQTPTRIELSRVPIRPTVGASVGVRMLDKSSMTPRQNEIPVTVERVVSDDYGYSVTLRR